MKTAISIPDATFQAAEQLASRLRMSRSALYSRAVEQYVAEHHRDSVTEAINSVLAAHPDVDTADPGWQAAAVDSLRRVEWRPRRPTRARDR